MIVRRGTEWKAKQWPTLKGHRMAKGYIIIFEGKGPLFEERHPSAVVHETYDDADAARRRRDQVGKPLDIIEINWDDTGAKMPWPP